MCTSSSTTSGRVRVMPATASATEPASPTRSTAPPSSARTPDRNIEWSSTRNTRTARSDAPVMACPVMACPVPSWLAPSWLAPCHGQLHLRAGARRAAHRRSPTVPFHPADYRPLQPVPVARHGVAVEAGTTVADEDAHPVRLDLRVQGHSGHSRVLGRVHQCLPGSLHDRGEPVVHLAVADHDGLDLDGVGILHLRGDPLQRR